MNTQKEMIRKATAFVSALTFLSATNMGAFSTFAAETNAKSSVSVSDPEPEFNEHVSEPYSEKGTEVSYSEEEFNEDTSEPYTETGTQVAAPKADFNEDAAAPYSEADDQASAPQSTTSYTVSYDPTSYTETTETTTTTTYLFADVRDSAVSTTTTSDTITPREISFSVSYSPDINELDNTKKHDILRKVKSATENALDHKYRIDVSKEDNVIIIRFRCIC